MEVDTPENIGAYPVQGPARTGFGQNSVSEHSSPETISLTLCFHIVFTGSLQVPMKTLWKHSFHRVPMKTWFHRVPFSKGKRRIRDA